MLRFNCLLKVIGIVCLCGITACTPKPSVVEEQESLSLPIEQAIPKHVEEKKAPIEEKVVPTTSTEEVTSSISLSKPIPRVVMALWDSKYENDIGFTTCHRSVEMPLNFYGVKVEYVDLQKPLPQVVGRTDVIGILSWLPQLYKLNNPKALIHWLMDAMDDNKKFMLIGTYNSANHEENMGLMSEIWQRLGVFAPDRWTSMTYDYAIAYQDPHLFHFEGEIPTPLPDFLNFNLADSNSKAHLSLKNNKKPQEEWPIVITNSKGAIAPEEYLLNRVFYSEEVYKRWLINPFYFLKLAFDLPDYPIPDPSTIAGRRAYFSHIDGDGWNNVTSIIENIAQKDVLSSEMILNQIVLASPDLPITIGPIAANLNQDWNGSSKSQAIARQFFTLPQVETGCHTYTHPFNWLFFQNYTAQKEIPYLNRYDTKTWRPSYVGALRRLFHKQETFYKVEKESQAPKVAEYEGTAKTQGEQFEQHYYTPRAYALTPFNLTFEITDAINEINLFTPKDKKVQVYQWSGDTLPWEKAIDLTEKDGVKNLNGGDPRFDFSHPSFSYTCALARRLGTSIQVYTCSSNENLYTDLWTKDFYGLATLPTTFERTETPLRIKAMNLYYHMYSGERMPSLHAVLRNIAYIRSQKIAPILASLYCETVDGFYSTEVLPHGAKEWRIQNRGRLQTFRIDRATFLGVDFKRSEGVVGQRHFQGSLYVYLEETVSSPLIAIKDIELSEQEPEAERSYLIESRWRVWNLTHSNPSMYAYTTQGFGVGDTVWKVPIEGEYEVKLFSLEGQPLESQTITSKNKTLSWTFSSFSMTPRHVEVILKRAADKEIRT